MNKTKGRTLLILSPIQTLETPIFFLCNTMLPQSNKVHKTAFNTLILTPKGHKTTFNILILTPKVYRFPTAITTGQLFQKVLNDNPFVDDAMVTGNSYRTTVLHSGFTISVFGYPKKMLTALVDLTSNVLSFLVEIKQVPEQHPALAEKYNLTMLLENPVWHIEQFIAEIENEAAVIKSLIMTEYTTTTGSVVVDIFYVGNVNESEVYQLAEVLQNLILKTCLLLSEDETPCQSSQLPIKVETLQVTCDYNLDLVGMVLLELICHLAYLPASQMVANLNKTMVSYHLLTTMNLKTLWKSARTLAIIGFLQGQT